MAPQRRPNRGALHWLLLACTVMTSTSALVASRASADGPPTTTPTTTPTPTPPTPTTATKDLPSAPAWRDRFDRARADLVEGRFQRAEVSFRALALEASSEAERSLALEMADLAVRYASRADTTTTPTRRRSDDAAASKRSEEGAGETRSTDELTLLYGTAALYGAGTGAWFLLQTRPNSTVTAALPFAALTAAPIIAVATVDGYAKLPRGLPHALSAGAYLGLQEGIWLVGYQHARATRIANVNPSSDAHWSPETSATILWGSATAGVVLGGVLGSTLVTTPGRVSFTSSTTMWSGAIAALGAGALLPDNDHRAERAFLAGGVGTNAGMASGLLFASEISPSVSRVRIVDLLGVAGALTTGGLYLAFANNVESRAVEGLAAGGAVLGLATGWLVTSGMKKQNPNPTTPATALALEPTLRVVAGGATMGVGGAF